MPADREPLIARKHHNRVVRVPRLLDRIQHAPDFVVEVRDARVIVREVLPHVVFDSRTVEFQDDVADENSGQFGR